MKIHKDLQNKEDTRKKGGDDTCSCSSSKTHQHLWPHIHLQTLPLTRYEYFIFFPTPALLYHREWSTVSGWLWFQLGLPRRLSGKESVCQCRRCSGKIPWKRKWQPTPVFLPGKSHGQRSLMGYNPWGRRESDTTNWPSTHACLVQTTLTKFQLHGLTHSSLLTTPPRGQDDSLKHRGKWGSAKLIRKLPHLSTTQCRGQCSFQVHLTSKHLLS